MNPLTPRQIQIATLIARGRLTKQIAHELNISVRTVGRHRQDIYERAGGKNPLIVVFYLLREGLMRVEPDQSVSSKQERVA